MSNQIAHRIASCFALALLIASAGAVHAQIPAASLAGTAVVTGIHGALNVNTVPTVVTGGDPEPTE